MDFSKFQSHLSNLDKLEFRTPTRPLVPLLFPTQIAGARLRAGQHDLAITCFYARSYAVSVLVIRVGGALQTIVKMFTDVLRTFACCVSYWRGDQQGGQYSHAKHKRALAVRYRHFSLPQSSSVSRFTAGAFAFFILSQSGGAPRTVGRVLPLRDNAFETKLAGMGEDGRAVALRVFVEPYAGAGLGHNRCERGLADLKRVAPHVVAVQFDQIEGV